MLVSVMSASDAVHPAPIVFDSDDACVSVSFHPSHSDTLAVGHMDGHITMHSIHCESASRPTSRVSAHRQSCRCLCFLPDGSRLVSASKDKSITTCHVGGGGAGGDVHLEQRLTKAHGAAIYSLLAMDNHVFASGDDDGHVKLWDLRQFADGKPVSSWHENEDYVSDMTTNSDRRILLTTSGEGTLTAYDVRSKKLLLQSELFDAELLSIDTVKCGGKVVCGGSDGVLHIFNWGEWGNMSDRCPLYPAQCHSIDCLRAATSDLLCAGCSDGTIKLVHILPNHVTCDDLTEGGGGAEPVMALSLSTSNVLASAAYSHTVSLHSLDDLLSSPPPTTGAGSKKGKRKAQAAPPRVKPNSNEDFFSGLAT